MPDRKWISKVIVDIKTTREGVAYKPGDLDEDAWSFGAPPPHEMYQLRVTLAKDGLTLETADNDADDSYIVANLECRIVSDNSDYDGIPVFLRVTTRAYRGHTLSTMEAMIVKMGFRSSLAKRETLTDRLVAEMLLAAIKKEPLVWAELDWRGSYSYTNSKGDTVWENPLRTYTDFPLAQDGARNHQMRLVGVDKQPHDIRAQLTVVKVYAKDDKELPKPGSIAAKDLETTRVQVGHLVQAKGGKVNGPTVVMATPTVQPAMSKPDAATVEDLDLLME